MSTEEVSPAGTLTSLGATGVNSHLDCFSLFSRRSTHVGDILMWTGSGALGSLQCGPRGVLSL